MCWKINYFHRPEQQRRNRHKCQTKVIIVTQGAEKETGTTEFLGLYNQSIIPEHLIPNNLITVIFT